MVMLMINKDILIKASKNKGITNKGFMEKAYYQDLLLYDLAKSDLDFVFKEGTALYLFYGLKRFSEDLDFNVSDLEKAKSKVESILKKRGLKYSYIKPKNTYLFKVEIKGPFTEHNTLRIDLSADKCLKSEGKEYVPVFTDIPPFIVKVMDIDEILVEKVDALTNGVKNKDLYDIFNLLRITEFNSQLWYKKFKDTKMDINTIRNNINTMEKNWKKLNTFVLDYLPEHKTVKKYVLDKLQNKSKKP